MNLIKPYAKILDGPHSLEEGIELLKKVEYIGRVSHRTEDKQTPESWRRFVEAVVLQHGDWSITEHVSVTVDAVVDRGITHEWVRHRLGAYTQESTRFVNYERKMPPSFILPIPENDTNKIALWKYAVQACEDSYKALIDSGVAPQIARSVFPNALASRIITTYNLRMWRHFFIMRTAAEAHPQMRQITIPLLQEFKDKIPLLYDDITPNQKQSEAMKRIR